MEIAVMADIHSNYVALEQCLSYAEKRGIGSFIFLGDYIGEFAYPERTMELLRACHRKYDCVFIRGNKEDYWLDYRAKGETGWRKYSSTTGALYYAYHSLAAQSLDFFDKLPIARKLQYGAMPTLIVCHGSPDSVRGGMKPGNEESKRMLEEAGVDWVLYGHTHIQGKTVHRGRTALNPGSVGVPLESDGRTQFTILHGRSVHGEKGCWKEEFVSLEYDRERVVRELYESGLMERAPHWCGITELLLQNKLPANLAHARILERVIALYEQETGEQGWSTDGSWPEFEDKYWERAIAGVLGNR